MLHLHRHTMTIERASMGGITRFFRCPTMRSRDHLFPAGPKIGVFLTDLPVHRQVSAATQNQAVNALVFLYLSIPNDAMEGRISAVCAGKKINVSVTMVREAVAAVRSLIDGTAPLVATLAQTRVRSLPSHTAVHR